MALSVHGMLSLGPGGDLSSLSLPCLGEGHWAGRLGVGTAMVYFVLAQL